MKMTIQIEIPDDFRMVCEIFDFSPEEVIREFTKWVSLPRYFSDVEYEHRWANLFFLDYIDLMEHRQAQPNDIHEKYMNILNKRTEAAKSSQKRENACREVLNEWHEAVKRQKDKENKA